MLAHTPQPDSALSRDVAAPDILRPKPLFSWIAMGLLVLYLFVCWAVFFIIYNPASPAAGVYYIESDSTAYYQFAGVLNPNAPAAQQGGDALVSFGGNLLGPVYLAKILRWPGNVLVFNTILFLVMIWLANGIPGVRTRVFVLLYIASAQTLVGITTLNKEILACFGLVAFMRYYYSKRRSWLLLGVALVFSLMARWEQIAVLLLFLAMRSRLSPFRIRPKTGLVAFIFALAVAYTMALRMRGGQLAAFLVMAQGGGTVARLDALQARFGFPLVVLPKLLMNLFDRWLTAWFFITPTYWYQDFHFLQNQIIIHLQTLSMLVLFAALLVSRRFHLYRPIPFLIALYAIAISVNPFIQPRYAYPIYVLLCLELARSKDALEPEPRNQKPARDVQRHVKTEPLPAGVR